MSSVELNDLVKITIPGLLHLTLLDNITYLAACAEDVIFKDTATMMRISTRLASATYLSKLSVALTANDMVQYLENYRSEFCSRPEVYIEEGNYIRMYDMEGCGKAINKWIDSDKDVKETYLTLQEYPNGKHIDAIVVNKNNGSLVCMFGKDHDVKGFISAYDKKYQLKYSIYETIKEGDQLKCEVLYYDYHHMSFQLKFIMKAHGHTL